MLQLSNRSMLEIAKLEVQVNLTIIVLSISPIIEIKKKMKKRRKRNIRRKKKRNMKRKTNTKTMRKKRKMKINSRTMMWSKKRMRKMMIMTMSIRDMTTLCPEIVPRTKANHLKERAEWPWILLVSRPATMLAEMMIWDLLATPSGLIILRRDRMRLLEGLELRMLVQVALWRIITLVVPLLRSLIWSMTTNMIQILISNNTNKRRVKLQK